MEPAPGSSSLFLTYLINVNKAPEKNTRRKENSMHHFNIIDPPKKLANNGCLTGYETSKKINNTFSNPSITGKIKGKNIHFLREVKFNFS